MKQPGRVQEEISRALKKQKPDDSALNHQANDYKQVQ